MCSGISHFKPILTVAVMLLRCLLTIQRVSILTLLIHIKLMILASNATFSLFTVHWTFINHIDIDTYIFYFVSNIKHKKCQHEIPWYENERNRLVGWKITSSSSSWRLCVRHYWTLLCIDTILDFLRLNQFHLLALSTALASLWCDRRNPLISENQTNNHVLALVGLFKILHQSAM